MIGVAVSCLPIFFTGYRIDRWEGVLFLGFYVAYIAYLWLGATGSAALPSYERVMLLFVVPLAGLTLAAVAIHAMVRPKER